MVLCLHLDISIVTDIVYGSGSGETPGTGTAAL
ncbi:hypothetical protein CNEO2_1460003 [Clostridium neonatale]|uniref:Uncharacterized protein n=1 Tax=Clostridium neonatale TaxID=137838 RepID=A0AAD1YDM5_9CLOT|nr:hypothetical protein CNEO2_1640003 [Clostridium neonatale]CAI3545250.1 hypothetical protein CNEO2_1560003 [Clostridium neonatale]CAI3545477.1 hypothetical protein CNEO3_1970003 [Clostridium neonatale]CAI3556771.1 hypothetical protein CNEO2_1460003 [Clostridium neonatale]CAI3567632.1 hypothetical protein CNEO3_1470003 [Clostridium neonatale]